MVPILYGMPAAEARAAEQRGEILLGGCTLTPHAKTHGCPRCGVPEPLGLPDSQRHDVHVHAHAHAHARTGADAVPQTAATSLTPRSCLVASGMTPKT